jgi:hypothetical protein
MRTTIRSLVILAIAAVGLSFPASVGAATTPLPGLPPSVESFAAVPRYGTYGNHQVPDCVTAAIGDVIQTWRGSGLLPTSGLLKVYQQLAVGSNAGISPTAAVTYWQTHWIDRYRIAATSGPINYRSRRRVETTLAANGALLATVLVPQADVDNYTVGLSVPWTVGAVRPGNLRTIATPKGSPVAGEHAMAVVGYDSTGPYVVAWGFVDHVTWGWWETWVTGAYQLVPVAR